MALNAALALLAANTRAWYEHAPSDANPSDGISRGGALDVYTDAKLRSGDWIYFTLPSIDWEALIGLNFEKLWDLVTASGC